MDDATPPLSAGTRVSWSPPRSALQAISEISGARACQSLTHSAPLCAALTVRALKGLRQQGGRRRRRQCVVKSTEGHIETWTQRVNRTSRRHIVVSSWSATRTLSPCQVRGRQPGPRACIGLPTRWSAGARRLHRAARGRDEPRRSAGLPRPNAWAARYYPLVGVLRGSGAGPAAGRRGSAH